MRLRRGTTQLPAVNYLIITASRRARKSQLIDSRRRHQFIGQLSARFGLTSARVGCAGRVWRKGGGRHRSFVALSWFCDASYPHCLIRDNSTTTNDISLFTRVFGCQHSYVVSHRQLRCASVQYIRFIRLCLRRQRAHKFYGKTSLRKPMSHSYKEVTFFFHGGK